MKLSETKVRNAKGKEKQYKLGDSGGLYLLVMPNSRKYWRMKYHFLNKEYHLALGVYPLITLAEARDLCFEARKLKAKGINPQEHKRQEQARIIQETENTFEQIAREWHAVRTSKWSEYYAKQVMQRMEADIFPKIGKLPIATIKSSQLFQMANAIQDRNAIEMAHRATSICSQVFQFALITDRAEQNPASALRGMLKAPQTNNYAYLNAKELPEFLKALKAYDGGIQTKLAIKFLILTFVRTGELCGARWDEIDLERAEWRIPAERMKMRSPHIVPLSAPAVTLLETLKRLSRKSEFVFPSISNVRKTMSTNTMLQAMYGMGYKDRVTGHGFRATASTILNESGLFSHDIIERQLAHQERNKVRASYNHADYLQERRKMMQWWADYIHQAETNDR